MVVVATQLVELNGEERCGACYACCQPPLSQHRARCAEHCDPSLKASATEPPRRGAVVQTLDCFKHNDRFALRFALFFLIFLS